MASSEDSGIPNEVKKKFADFDTSLSEVESVLQPLLRVPQNELFEKLSPLDRAKVDLVGAYTINALFWMYLNVCGLNPKEHSVKQELDRIRSYMNRVKQCQDKAKAPKLDKAASKRFVKSALWQAAKARTQESSGRSSPIPSEDIDPTATTSQGTDSSRYKRKHQSSSEEDNEEVKEYKKQKSGDQHHRKKKKKKNKNDR